MSVQKIMMNNDYKQLSRQASAEGMVLLKNNDEILPFQLGECISVFGRCQFDYYKSGTGSGGAVNVAYKVNAIEGLLNSETIKLNQDLVKLYAQWIEAHPFDTGGGGWAAEPWFQNEMPLTNKIVSDAHAISDKAIVVIGRTAGEDQDNDMIEGSYFLTKAEKEILQHVTNHFDKVVVVLNISNIIDMSWTTDASHRNEISAVLIAWHGGIEGGNALADILTGEVSPSGKLTDTIAYQIEDYPSTRQFGNVDKNIYIEDIYVGYKYFETFDREKIQYAFGFGLSYTSFKIDIVSSKLVGEGSEGELQIELTTENTGSHYSGQEVIQLYYNPPQGKLGKPSLNLGAFVKTKVLLPGEKQSLQLSLPMKNIASYDDSGATGYRWAYVLESGEYRFLLGSSSQSAEQITVDGNAYIYLEDTLLTLQLQEAIAPVEDFERMKPGELLSTGVYSLTYESVPSKVSSTEERMMQNKFSNIKQTGNLGYVLKDVANGRVDLESFVAQLTTTELATLVKGEGMSSSKATAGTAAAFGGLTKTLRSYGIPVGCAADGPSGIRMDSGKKAFQIGIGTLLACTWNTPLIENLYEYVGKELVENKIDTLLGPGMNIHRHPLNGRNFEYFSEDPLLSGLIAAAICTGIKNGGSHATLKHFAANDQEKERFKVNSVISERALREVHLKPFELAVKLGGAISIMTSYNPINGIYAASNYDLNTTILRGEWGYKGIVMTDWWAKTNHPVTGGEGTTYTKSYMIKAQNDLYMVVGNDDAHDFTEDDLLEAVESGELSIGELQRCVMNICNFFMNAQCFNKSQTEDSTQKFFPKSFANTEDAYPANEYIQLKINTHSTINIYIEKASIYEFKVKMRYIALELAQAACNFSLNGEYAATAQLHGSQHAWKESTLLETFLDAGIYELTLDFVKAGIEIDGIEFLQAK